MRYRKKDLQELSDYLRDKGWNLLKVVYPLNQKTLKELLLEERGFLGRKTINPYHLFIYQAIFCAFERLPLILHETKDEMCRDIITWRLCKGI